MAKQYFDGTDHERRQFIAKMNRKWERKYRQQQKWLDDLDHANGLTNRHQPSTFTFF